MIDGTEARNHLEEILNELKKSVREENNEVIINDYRNKFNRTITEYKEIIGRKDFRKYLNSFTEIVNGEKIKSAGMFNKERTNKRLNIAEEYK